jgi:hypothetical protein
MTEVERLRQRAERALRLARGFPVDDLKLALRIAAADYLRRAVELEQGANQQSQRLALAPHHAQQQQQQQQQQASVDAAGLPKGGVAS